MTSNDNKQMNDILRQGAARGRIYPGQRQEDPPEDQRPNERLRSGAASGDDEPPDMNDLIRFKAGYGSFVPSRKQLEEE